MIGFVLILESGDDHCLSYIYIHVCHNGNGHLIIDFKHWIVFWWVFFLVHVVYKNHTQKFYDHKTALVKVYFK
jgi:hypothetical protein